LSIFLFQQVLSIQTLTSLGQFLQVSHFSIILFPQKATQGPTSSSHVLHVSPLSILPFQQTGPTFSQISTHASWRSCGQLLQSSHLSTIPFQQSGLLGSIIVHKTEHFQSLQLLAQLSHSSHSSIFLLPHVFSKQTLTSSGQFVHVSHFSIVSLPQNAVHFRTS
jgi:hypothetical protein